MHSAIYIYNIYMDQISTYVFVLSVTMSTHVTLGSTSKHGQGVMSVSHAVLPPCMQPRRQAPSPCRTIRGVVLVLGGWWQAIRARGVDASSQEDGVREERGYTNPLEDDEHGGPHLPVQHAHARDTDVEVVGTSAGMGERVGRGARAVSGRPRAVSCAL
jgi:hypothetical protein